MIDLADKSVIMPANSHCRGTGGELENRQGCVEPFPDGEGYEEMHLPYGRGGETRIREMPGYQAESPSGDDVQEGIPCRVHAVIGIAA
jgi:hypothetical protein